MRIQLDKTEILFIQDHTTFEWVFPKEWLNKFGKVIGDKTFKPSGFISEVMVIYWKCQDGIIIKETIQSPVDGRTFFTIN